MSSDLASLTSVFERVEVLNGSNYRSWSFVLKMLLVAKDMWEVIDPAEHPPDDKKTAQTAWDKKDKAVFANIALAMKPSKQKHIYGCTTAKKA